MASSSYQTFKNLFFNIVSFGVNFCISFLLTPYLIKNVGKEAYSFFPLINSIIGYSSILTTAVGSMAGRFITMRIYQNDIIGANKYFNSVWVANALLSTFFTIIAVFCVVFIDTLISVPAELLKDVQWLFGLGSATLIIGLLSGILGIGTFVKNRVDLLASRSVLAECAKVIIIVSLLYLFKPSIIYMGIGAFIAALLFFFFNISFKQRLLPELTFAPQKYFSLPHLKEVFFSGIWNSINQLSSILLQQVDLLITNIFIGVSATGNYSIAKTAPLFIYSALAMLSGTFFPQFNILFAQDKTSELVSEIKRSMKIVGLLIGIPIGFLLVYSKEFYTLWVPGEDANLLYKLTVVTVLPLMIGGSVNPIFGVFPATNKLKVPSIVLLIAGVLNTLVIFILLATTDLGIWAIAITGAIQGGLRNMLFTTTYGAICLKQEWYTFFPVMVKGCFGMAIVAIVGFTLKSILPPENWGLFITSFIIVAIVASAINFFFIFEKKEREILFSTFQNRIKKS
jgi:O-antigen/teichoic acid export membrane protein